MAHSMNIYNLWLIYSFSDHLWFMGIYLFYDDFIYDLFNDAVNNTSGYGLYRPNINKVYCSQNGHEKNRSSLILCIIAGLFWRVWGQPSSLSVAFAGLRAKTWSQKLLKSKQECHPLFRGFRSLWGRCLSCKSEGTKWGLMTKASDRLLKIGRLRIPCRNTFL